MPEPLGAAKAARAQRKSRWPAVMKTTAVIAGGVVGAAAVGLSAPPLLLGGAVVAGAGIMYMVTDTAIDKAQAGLRKTSKAIKDSGKKKEMQKIYGEM